MYFHNARWLNRLWTAPFGMLALALVSALSLSGCIGLTSAGTPPTSGSPTGTLAASATSVSFGSVPVGSSAVQSLTLNNAGTAAVMITQTTISGAGFSIVGSTSSISVPPGQSHAFQIQFTPQLAGTLTGSISVNSNAVDPSLSVALVGAALPVLAIASQPANQSVVAGQTANFAVAATGAETVTYLWKKNGTPIPGATSASYATPATTTADNGSQFIAVVSDGTSTATSNPALLTVTAASVAPSITQQPANQTVTAGQPANFTVVANGTAPLTYQWNKNSTPIAGATLAAYSTGPTAASDTGEQFSVTVTNSAGNVTSNPAALTVNVLPVISAQPANQTVAVGQTATFGVTATGSGTLSYQWKKNGVTVAGGTSAAYTTPAASVSDNGSTFTVTITGGAGSVTSNPATLTVNAPPSISAQPGGKSVIAGQTATFSVAAIGSGTLTYQWSRNGTAVSGATSASYTTPPTSNGDNGAQFTVAITNSVGNVVSNPATLTVTPATYILNVTQTSISFGAVSTGSSSVQGVTFTNAGNSTITISGVSISGAGFTAGGISTGEMVSPGQSVTFNVTFAPAAAGSVTGSTTVSSNAASSPTMIALSGTGTQPVAHSVTLGWTASSSNPAGYNVYRSTISGGPYAKVNSSSVNSTSYTDASVQSGQTYFYSATSVDSSGNESPFSTEVTATIP